jgi:hypothetical protein
MNAHQPLQQEVSVLGIDADEINADLLEVANILLLLFLGFLESDLRRRCMDPGSSGAGKQSYFAPKH